MTDRYVRISELTSAPKRSEKRPARVGRYPWSESTLWRKVAAGMFPKPVTLAGVVCWPLDAVEQWEAEQRQQEHSARPHIVDAAKRSVQSRRAKRESEAAA